MTLTITYPLTGTRTHSGMSQREINKLISFISSINEQAPVPLRISVKD